MMNEEQKQKRNRKANPDRITLSKEALNTLTNMEGQIEKAFGSMVKLKYKDLTNFLLEVRSGELTNAEMKMIKTRYFDEVRAATWALHKLKEAKERGQELKLSELLAQLQTPLVKEKSKHKSLDKRRSSPESGTPAGHSGAPVGATSGAQAGPSKGQASAQPKV